MTIEHKTHKTPNISKRAFWDIPFENIDWDNNPQYLIIKVLLHGSFDDVLGLINYYGEGLIKNELLKADSLPGSVYYFALTYFNLKKSDFKCSITKL